LMVLPALVLVFKRVRYHYRLVGVQISLRGFKPPQALSRHTVVVPVSGLARQVVLALQYARLLSRDVRAVYINQDAEATANLRAQWQKWGHDVPLIVLDSPYRSIVQPLLHYIEQVHDEHPDQIVTVILPEFIPAKWWQQFLHNQTALQIKGALLFKRGVVVTSVPYHLRR